MPLPLAGSGRALPNMDAGSALAGLVVDGCQKARISDAAKLTFPGSMHGRAMGLLLRFSLSCCPRQCGVWGSAPGCCRGTFLRQIYALLRRQQHTRTAS